MVKGFVLSQYLYENPNIRDFSDIDFLVHEDDIITACTIVEELGGQERLITHLENNDVHLSQDLKEYLFFSNKEKKFDLKGRLVEIKKSSPYYENKLFEAFDDNEEMEFGRYAFEYLEYR